MPVVLPSVSEADVAGADAAPGKNTAKSTDSQHPVESLNTNICSSCNDEAQQTDRTCNNDTDKRTAGIVDISKYLRCLTTVCESCHCA